MKNDHLPFVKVARGNAVMSGPNYVYTIATELILNTT